MLMMQEAWGVANFNPLTGFSIASNNVWNIMEPLKITVPKFGEISIIELYAISSLAKGWNIVGPFIFTTGLVLGVAFAFRWTER